MSDQTFTASELRDSLRDGWERYWQQDSPDDELDIDAAVAAWQADPTAFPPYVDPGWPNLEDMTAVDRVAVALCMTPGPWWYSSTVCEHCGRVIEKAGWEWIDPEATGDDSVWRETCDAHDSFLADHEPTTPSERGNHNE